MTKQEQHKENNKDYIFSQLDRFLLSSGRSATSQIYDYMRKSIISGQIPPNTPLSENYLCDFFSVSRQPIREVLLKLSMDSLVKIYPQRGSIVTKISVPMILSSQFIRESVEVESLRRAIDNRSDDFISNLHNELIVQRVFIETTNIQGFFTSDQKFHRLISEQSGVYGVWEGLRSQRSFVDRVRYLSLHNKDWLMNLLKQHEDIVKYIEEGDSQRAVELMHNHTRRVTGNLSEIIQEYPEFFDTEYSADIL